MVADSSTVDAVFQALAHEARRGMLRSLAGADRSVGELARPLRMTFAGASKHVAVLERAGLVQRSVVGRKHMLRLVPGPLASAAGWLGYYVDDRTIGPEN